MEKTPIDNILVNSKARVKSLRIPMVYISDHLPLMLNFK